jgi:ABC-2 type transport system ATP-binding protein
MELGSVVEEPEGVPSGPINPESRRVPLRVDAVSKRFRRRRSRRIGRGRPGPAFHVAVDNVSFAMQPAEIYGVIGANGSGKSTLIRMLSTLLLPDAGTIEVFGLDVVREASSVRTLINRVSADPSFFRGITPLENLIFFGGAYGLSRTEARNRSRQILDRLGLERDRFDEQMLRLSRGQQQKVAVARAFLTSPRLMLLDEPTTGLDPRSKRDVQRFVGEVREEDGVAILLTTHDMDEAELLCDRMAFLAGGRVVAEGSPRELRQRVASQQGVADVDMEAVFMELTGRTIDEDEEFNDADA